MRSDLVFALLVSLPSLGHAQTRPQFDVVSIKQNLGGLHTPQRAAVQSGDRVTFTNVAARVLILEAYADSASELVGGPDWIGKSDQPNFDVPRFDVAAKAAAPASREELRTMLRAWLADRFKLATHIETRRSQIWALVLAHRDGSLGPQLHQAKASCADFALLLRTSAATIRAGVVPFHVLS